MATIAEALQLAITHFNGGRVAEAERVCLVILRAVPDTVTAAYLLGSIRAAQGRLRHARNPLAWAVALEPANAAYRVALANVALVEGDATRAEAMHRHTVRVAKERADVWAGWAAALQALARSGPAAACCRKALALAPAYDDAWINLADAEVAGKRAEPAHRAVDRALRIAPGRPPALMIKGLAAALSGADVQADAILSDVLAREPGLPGGWENLGALRARNGRAAAAEAAFAEAAARHPGQTLWNLRGAARLALGRPAEALKDLDRAVAGRPDDDGLAWNRGLARLTLGDLARGWVDYDRRTRCGHGLPLWRGEDIAGKRILLYAEQGLGDTLQFIRYVPLVAARGARIALEVQPSLLPLVAGLPGLDAVVAQGEPLPDAEIECPLLSLPRAFATTLDSIPSAVPYLRADPALVTRWRGRLGDDGPKVGLVWAGNPNFTADRLRSPGLAALRPLLDIPGVRFFGLQMAEGRRDLERVALPSSFCDLGGAISGFSDTAAIVENLDLVISSCTAPAHLVGALGRPLWMVLAFAADWRWLIGRDDSPWYPTARLFRQSRIGDWPGVVARLTTALVRWRDRR